MSKQNVVISLLGTTVDRAGSGQGRWDKWCPTVSLCQHEDFLVSKLELLFSARHTALAETVTEDIRSVSPETEVAHHTVELHDPWSFEETYSKLQDFAENYAFDTDRYNYLVHITTGTHVAQICLFLLTEARYFPACLLQTGPPAERNSSSPGTIAIIDLDLSKYDSIARRLARTTSDSLNFLKAGINTRNARFNRLIEEIELVGVRSREPVLLLGPTGAGKSSLARRLYELKKLRHQLSGPFVEVNCATIRGDGAMSALFGHAKGAFTGALQARAGLLKSAGGGVLFLDEIGELGLDEQAMLLRAVEERTFLPVGSDKAVTSSFQLIAGTNRDLSREAAAGRFRADLFARINLWTFYLPPLKDRPEDIEPNFDYEISEYMKRNQERISVSKEARERFLKFAASREALWTGNFRDLNAAVRRMATLAPGGRISVKEVEAEAARLRRLWTAAPDDRETAPPVEPGTFDLFDELQLKEVLRVCRSCRSLSDAGRKLFNVTRDNRKTPNDADRLRKYLLRFDLTWEEVHSSSGASAGDRALD